MEFTLHNGDRRLSNTSMGFRPSGKVKEMSKKILEDQYYLFWGEYKVQDKHSSKFKYNNEWAVYLQSNCGKFKVVKKSREYLVSEDSK